MSEKVENPPAFACAAGTPDNGDWQGGMSLRDYFAGQAIQGLCAYSGSIGFNHGCKEIADRAFSIADNMLLTRKL